MELNVGSFQVEDMVVVGIFHYLHQIALRVLEFKLIAQP